MNNKKLKGLGVRALALVATLVLVVGIINTPLFDEDLHPDLQQLMSPAESVAVDSNAYTVLMGLLAASDRDAFEVGSKYIAELRKLHQSGQPIALTRTEHEQLLGDTDLDLEWKRRYPTLSCNPRQEPACAEQLVSDLSDPAPPHPRAQIMLERYQELISQPRFEEIDEIDLNSPLPAYGDALQLSRLQLALTRQAGDPDRFIEALAKDTAFWRKLLGDGESLIAKMVGAAGLWSDLQFASEFVANTAVDESRLQRLHDILRPLSPEEQNIGEAFLSEQRYLVGLRLDSDSLAKRWLVALSFQENASMNLMYSKFTLPLMATAKQSGRQFARHLETKPAQAAKLYNVFPPTLYNLGGKMILSSTTTAAEDYIARIHDLSTMFLLVALQLELKAAKTSDIARYIAGSALRNNVRGEPFSYDAKKEILSFRCLRPENACSVKL